MKLNYMKIHDSIIKNSKFSNRSKNTGIYEEHHIILKSCGGTDDDENLVLLTPKEHYIIHLLLYKINKDYKHLAPLLFFKEKGSMCSRIYQMVRENHIIHMKTNNPSARLTEESKMSKSEKLRNRVFTDAHREKISKSNKGKQPRLGAIISDKQKDKLSNSLKKWHETNVVSEETRYKISKSNTGKKHSSESIDKQRKAALNRQKFCCKYCGIIYDAGNMTQHMRKKHNEEWNRN